MDLVAACRAFLAVSSQGSFTVGAATAGIPQSVASRRVASLEEHLGGRLIDRSTRRAALTLFGRDLLPAAQRLVDVADAMDEQAARARQRTLTLAVPDEVPAELLVRLVAQARRQDLRVGLRPAGPLGREELVRTREARAALVAVPPDEGAWRVPLGLAAAAPAAGARPPSPVHLDTLRGGRFDDGPPRRVWVQPEDDLPHVRDRLARACGSVGLLPAQLAVAASLVAGAAEVLSTQDLLLCSRGEARRLDLAWRRIADVRLERGYLLLSGQREDAERLRALVGPDLARCLGALDARRTAVPPRPPRPPRASRAPR